MACLDQLQTQTMQSIQVKARKPSPVLAHPGLPPQGILPRAGGGMWLRATSTLPDNCGYNQQGTSRRRPQERGHEAPKIPKSEAPALLGAGWHGHSLSVISPRPWAYSRSRSLVTSSFSSRISLLLGSSLIMALQRICLARSAYLGSKRDGGIKGQVCRAGPGVFRALLSSWKEHL